MVNLMQDHFMDPEGEIYACGGLREEDRLDVLELCCEENSLLTDTINKMGGKAERAGLFNGCDILKVGGRERIRHIIRIRRPKWIWVAYPCGASSPIQRLNEISEEGWYRSMRRKQKSRRPIKLGNELLAEHLQGGGHVAWEWPRYNDGWYFPEVKAFWKDLDYEDHNFDGCMFGLRPEGFHKKPWTVRSSRSGVFELMERKCNGSHTHVPFGRWLQDEEVSSLHHLHVQPGHRLRRVRPRDHQDRP